MRTTRLRIVPGRGEVLWPSPGGKGGVVTWSQGGGRCCDLVWGRCCDLIRGEGGVVTWSGGEGGVVTWSGGGVVTWCQRGGVVTWSQGEVLWPGPGGGRCCDLVPRGRRCCDLVPGGEVLWPGPGGQMLWPGPGGGVVTWSWSTPPPSVTEWQTPVKT